jgi:hypothetical protein
LRDPLKLLRKNVEKDALILEALAKNKSPSQLITSKYSKGTIPIKDTMFSVWTWNDEQFEKTGKPLQHLGTLFISGKYVGEQMDLHQSIKGYGPYSIAQKLAEKLFPEYDFVIIKEVHGYAYT